MTAPLTPLKPRYRLLDELRGFLVFCMVFYHGFFTVALVFGSGTGDILFNFFMPAEPFFAGGFILISGCMCNFSRSNLKRGSILFVIALVVSAVTIGLEPYVGGIAIYFGILHLLSVAMILAGLLNGLFSKINPWVGLLACLIVFLLTYGIPPSNHDFLGVSHLIPEQLHQINWLFPLGFCTSRFQSADYFPQLPWLFLFFVGIFFGKLGLIQKYNRVFMPSRIPPLAFLGRHALIIYVLHQPVIFGLTSLISLVLKGN